MGEVGFISLNRLVLVWFWFGLGVLGGEGTDDG